MEPVANSAEPAHRHLGLLVVAGLSLLVNALLVAAVVTVLASGSAQDWLAGRLDLATADDVRAVETAAAEANRAAADALAEAGRGPSDTDLSEVRARVSDFDLRLSSLGSTVREQQASLAAACDWARLQETNFLGSDLGNVFFDYAQTVCAS